jgi:hypothetical protein
LCALYCFSGWMFLLCVEESMPVICSMFSSNTCWLKKAVRWLSILLIKQNVTKCN